MNYKSIVLNLDIDGIVVPVIKLAVDLAQRFDARLIGLSAADVPPPLAMEARVAFEGESMAWCASARTSNDGLRTFERSSKALPARPLIPNGVGLWAIRLAS